MSKKEDNNRIKFPSKNDFLRFLDVDEEYPDINLLHQIMETTIKLAVDRAERGDLKIAASTLKEIRFSFKLFSKYKDFRKISIFGSSRTKVNHPEYKFAKDFSKLMSQAGYMVITGAASGIMKAGHEGAGKKMSFGLNIRLPFEQKANWIIHNDPKLINYKYFFTRKLFFMKESQAIILCPGGFGTLDEGFEALTLLQTGKAQLMPVIMLAPPGNPYWIDWLAFIKKRLVRTGHICSEDLNLFKVTDSIQEAKEEIDNFYRVYHSMRYVRNILVIRLQHPISPYLVDLLNREFKGILESGQIRQGKALREEKKEHSDLSRLLLHFDQQSLGKLRLLINKINLEGHKE